MTDKRSAPSGAPDAPAPTIEKLTGYVGDGIHYRLPKSRQSAHLAHDLTTLNFNAWPRAKGTLVTAEVVELFQVVGLLPVPPEGAQQTEWMTSDVAALAVEYCLRRHVVALTERPINPINPCNQCTMDAITFSRRFRGLRVPQSAPEPKSVEQKPWTGVWNNWIAPFHACPRCAKSLNWNQIEDSMDEPWIRADCCGGIYWFRLTWFAAPPNAPAPTPSHSVRQEK